MAQSTHLLRGVTSSNLRVDDNQKTIKNMKKLLILLVTAAAVVGCCSTCRSRVKNAKPLEGTVWHLVKMGGESKTLPADSFNLILKDNNVGGVAACNSLVGNYAVGEKFKLRLSSLGTTMMLCPQNGELEQKYLNILAKTTHYDIDYNLLMLMENGTILAVFEAQPQK